MLLSGLEVAAYSAKCCCPLVGDAIVGYVTRGRGLSIHRSDCQIATELDSKRIVRDISWDSPSKQRKPTMDIAVKAVNRVDLTHDIIATATQLRKNIVILQRSNTDPSVLRFSVQVLNPDEVRKLIEKIKKLPEVVSVSLL